MSGRIIYLIFRKDKFVAYARDKKLVKRFQTERRGKYQVEKIDETLLSEDLRQSDDFYMSQLDLYREYDAVLTEKECLEILNGASAELNALVDIQLQLIPFFRYVKFTDEEELVLRAWLSFMRNIQEDLAMEDDYESNVFIGDYFDMKEIVQRAILQKKQ